MRFIFLLIGLVVGLPNLLRGEVINQPVVNIYLQPEEDTEIDSQAIYSTLVKILDQMDNDWLLIRTPDGVQGWIKSSQVTKNSSFETSNRLRPVQNLFAHIYRVTDTTPFPPLMTIPYGAKVKVENISDKEERWIRIELISGEKAWIQRGDIDFTPQYKTLEETVAFSKKFLGLPYTWGGTSSYGYDCSGFVQMLYREMGILLPRNSRDQAQSDLLIPVERENLQPGDLVFFGTTKIVHVGLYLGNEEFIHSGVTEIPIVMISNLQNKKYNLLAARRIAF